MYRVISSPNVSMSEVNPTKKLPKKTPKNQFLKYNFVKLGAVFVKSFKQGGDTIKGLKFNIEIFRRDLSN